MTENLKPTEQLNRKASVLAGIVCGLLALAGLAGTVAFLAAQTSESPLMMAIGMAKVAILMIALAASFQLTRRRIWAQRTLLVVFLAGLISAVCTAVATLQWGEPAWLAEWLKIDWSMLQILPVVAAPSILAVVLLYLAASAGTRLRYATNVTVAIAAALALIIVVNLVAQGEGNYRRLDVETLQRYGLSQRTKRILDAVDSNIRLSCVYTDTDKKSKTPERRARVLEMLEEMRQYKRDIEVVNVTSDSDKAELVERLRTHGVGQASRHVAWLKRFVTESDKIKAFLVAEQKRWGKIKGKSYLSQWTLVVEAPQALSAVEKNLDKTRQEIAAQLDGEGIVEYTQLVEQAANALTNVQTTVDEISKVLAQFEPIPAAIRINRDKVLGDAYDAVAVVEAVGKKLGKEGEPLPEGVKAVLEQFIEDATKAAVQVGSAGRAIDNVAGREMAEWLRKSRAWVKPGGSRGINIGGKIYPTERRTISDLYSRSASGLLQLKNTTQDILKATTAEYQQTKYLPQLRATMDQILDSLRSARKLAVTALDKLTVVDPATGNLLASSGGEGASAEIVGLVQTMRKAIGELPELGDSSLAADITGKNIVLVEAGGKAEVVDFETVWPLKTRQFGPAPADDEAKRVFNGDSAISSRILSQTTEPFATVLLTYYLPDFPPEMAQQAAQVIIPDVMPQMLTTLKSRLEAANFEVADWNVAKEIPAPSDPNRPQVLLLLPPPTVMPTAGMRGMPPLAPFGPEHLARIRRAIDEGNPAIFLGKYLPPKVIWQQLMPSQYQFGPYLLSEWGIDLRHDFLTIPAKPDEDKPGKFGIAPFRFSHLPLSTYTDHKIGLHLQGQRTLWSFVAPILIASTLPEGVQVEPVLTVPTSWKDTWATSRFQDLLKDFQEKGFVSPDYEQGDLPAGYHAIVAASRAGTDTVKPARIVVLGVGAGLQDGYLDGPVTVASGEGENITMSLSDAPHANADVVINSLYWLTGRERFIARGPAKIKPIAMIDESMLWMIKGLCLIALPAVVLILGVVVMIVRRGA